MHCKSRQVEQIVLCALAVDGTGEEQCVNDENGMICKLLIHSFSCSFILSFFSSLIHSSIHSSTLVLGPGGEQSSYLQWLGLGRGFFVKVRVPVVVVVRGHPG